jgi:hypothetical protein
LDGKKTWKIQGSATKIRGHIALIRSGSGTVVGVCDLLDCVGPLTLKQMKEATPKHQIGVDQLQDLPYGNRTYAWVIGNARKLPKPASYRHPPGAVIWVRLLKEYKP